jgi:hypothetical protein
LLNRSEAAGSGSAPLRTTAEIGLAGLPVAHLRQRIELQRQTIDHQ